MSAAIQYEHALRGFDQFGQVKDIEPTVACPVCKAVATIKTASQTVCMACGHREMSEERIEELAQDFAEGEVEEVING